MSTIAACRAASYGGCGRGRPGATGCPGAPDPARPDTGSGPRRTSRIYLLDCLDPRTVVLTDKAYEAEGIRNLIQGQARLNATVAPSL